MIKMVKTAITSPPLLSNPSLPCTWRSGSSLLSYLSITLVSLLASERKQALTVVMSGVFSVSISSRRSSNSFTANPRNPGTNSSKSSRLPKLSIKPLNYLTELWISFLESSTMLLLPSTISKPGSPATTTGESSSLAPTALITNLVP